MKRRRTILLLILYLLVFVFTIGMEYFSIMNPGRRLLVNGSTFLMALVSGVLFWLIYRGDRQREDTKEKAVERKKVVERNKGVEGNKGAEGGKGNVAGKTESAELTEAELVEAEVVVDGSDEADVHESGGAKVDADKVVVPDVAGVEEADFIESIPIGEEESDLMKTYEVGKSGSAFVQKRKEKQLEEHRPTVMEKLEKTREDVLFDKGKYLAFANSHQLTRREAEIGLLVMNGYSNMQIAETLFIAETTVKKHLSHIYEKAGISGRKEFRQSVNAWHNTGGGIE